MKSLRIIYHIALADFLERTRSYSFLVTLGLVIFLGYQTANGTLSLQLGDYRGEFNSAWVSAMMSIVATFFLGWFGFYIVKGSIARDRETGIGQIMASTPITRLLYMFGKWLSNLTVLLAMVVLLALAGIIIYFWKGESTQFNLVVFLAPFLFIVLPLIAFVAAIAALYETIPILQGGFGNIVYFIGFVIGNMSRERSIYEPTGIGLLEKSMGNAARAVYPDYTGYFSLGSTKNVFTFTWPGIHWTLDIILARFAFIGLAVFLVLLAALFFDRFDSSRRKPRRIKKTSGSQLDLQPVAPTSALSTLHLTPLNPSANRYNFSNVLLGEIRLLLKGQRWWWYLIALCLIIACFNSDSRTAHETILPIAWVWHILLVSPLGNRESHHNVNQLAFSSASPLKRQLPAQWLAGFIVTLIMGSGAALRFILSGDFAAMISLLAGAIFIPSLALALGIWSGISKVFEIVYLTIWYMGPVSLTILPLDFINTSGTANPVTFILFSLLLGTFAAFGRAEQLKN